MSEKISLDSSDILGESESVLRKADCPKITFWAIL